MGIFSGLFRSSEESKYNDGNPFSKNILCERLVKRAFSRLYR